MVIIYTDGSSTGKIGSAGCAILIIDGEKQTLITEPIDYLCGNNAAELYGIYVAVRELPIKATAKIITDSNNAIMWLTGDWNRNNPQIKAIAGEIDKLWEEKDLTLSFQWVKSHGKNKYNNFVDKAAKRAKKERLVVKEYVNV